VSGPPHDESASRGSVLVVDRDEQVRRALAHAVAGHGFACRGAGTGAEARALIAAEPPDLVLLDVQLPDEPGLSLVRDLVADPDGPAVVMISAEDDPEVAAIALESGAYGYLTKPFRPNEVAIALHDGLRRHRRERESRATRARLEDTVVQRGAAARDALARLRQAHEETVLRLSRAIEYRDPESGPHIDRMSRYSGLLAARLGLDPDEIRVAARLHDIGKIAVPDSILSKPGPLTAEERAVMEEHAETGHRLLRGSGIELLDVAATIAWTHHERFDGSGYPRGLAAADIPLSGRIAAVADVFDALITNRSYRPARSVEEAVATVAGERGRHLDPDAVDAFMDQLDAVEAIAARFEEPAGRVAAEPPAAADAAPAAPAVLVTLQQAAGAVGVSASTLRRWADEGRIQAVRTAGGHRRFPLDAVRRLASERGPRGAVRPVAPPAEPLPGLAGVLAAGGGELAAAAAAATYRGGPAGWFAAADAAPAIAEWLAAFTHGTARGRYEDVLEATATVMRRASLQGTPLLERHRFLERFGDAAVRELSQAGAPQAELAGTRRLLAALAQAQLDGRS
jgi:putative two-component system response regulator